MSGPVVRRLLASEPARVLDCIGFRGSSCPRCTLPLAAIIALLAGCATLDPQQRPPEVRTITNTVSVPVPVPCFTEAERPILAPLTPIDIDRATVDQMAAALAADDTNEALYRSAVDALFLKCTRTGGTK